MNTTFHLGEILIATLASVALALGLDWLLLCAAFRAMSGALSPSHVRRALVPVRIHEEAAQMSSARRRAA